MITTEYLSGLDRFNLIMRKRVTSKYIGARPSLMMGRGTTIRDYRIYAEGDDFRAIDWKVYARTDNLYVKRYEEERNLTVHVIIDSSASMNYGHPTKFEYASMLGIGFAYIAMRGNEKFQYALFSDSMRIFQPKRGLSHLANMVTVLNQTRPDGRSDFEKAISGYRKVLGSKSLVIIISDFLMDPDSLKRALYQFGHNQVRVIQVLDPAERHLSIEGDIRLTDLESKAVMRTYISNKFRSEYQGRIERHMQSIEKSCVAIKSGFSAVTTDTPIFDAFHQILDQ